MKRVVIASHNPVKINAVMEGFGKMFPDENFTYEEVSVNSDVNDQPMTDVETVRGALNRVRNARGLIRDADFYIGIEGGLEEKEGEMEVFAWVLIQSRDGLLSKGKSASFFLPEKVSELIKQGMELGSAVDAVFNENNAKQKQGAIGILTDNNIDRTKYYIDPVILALIPFKNPSLYNS